MHPSRDDATIVVIGAGIAGLTAANRLINQHQFQNVIILEAQDRIGGRIHDAIIDNYPVPTGAQFLHDKRNEVYKLAQKLSVLPSKKVLRQLDETSVECFLPGGERVPEHLQDQLSDWYDETDEWLDLAGKKRRQFLNEPIGHYFSDRFESMLKKYNGSAEDKATLRGLKEFYMRSIEAEHGCACLDQLSFRVWSMWEGNGDLDASPMMPGGYKKVLDHIAAGVPNDRIRLNTPVIGIDWTWSACGANGQKMAPVEIAIESGESIFADHVIVTCSLGVLKANAAKWFTPTLPTSKTNAIRDMGFDTLDKVWLLFEERFWPANVNELAFVRRESANIEDNELRNIFWSLTTDPWNDRLLCAWVGGQYSKLMESASEDELAAAVTDVLKKFTDYKDIKPPIKTLKTTWQSNPYFLGAYSYYSKAADNSNSTYQDIAEPLKIMRNIHDMFRTPIVLFAGEATHASHFQTTHGAFESGVREAARLDKFYCKHLLSFADGRSPTKHKLPSFLNKRQK